MDLDRIAADRYFRIKRDGLRRGRCFQLDTLRMIAPEHVRRQHHPFAFRTCGTGRSRRTHAQGGEVRQQGRGSSRHLETIFRLRISIADVFRVTVQAQSVVTSGRNPDCTAVSVRKFIAQNLSSVGRKQIARHGFRSGVRGIAPVENHIYNACVRVIVAKILMFAGCRA